MKNNKLVLMLLLLLVFLISSIEVSAKLVSEGSSCYHNIFTNKACEKGGTGIATGRICECTGAALFRRGEWKCTECPAGTICDDRPGPSNSCTPVKDYHDKCDPDKIATPNDWQCIGNNECQCKDEKFYCTECKKDKPCETNTGRCMTKPLPECKVKECKPVKFVLQDATAQTGICTVECTCQDCTTGTACLNAAKARYPQYKDYIESEHTYLMVKMAKGVKAADCKAVIKPGEDIHRECREKMTARYSCTDMTGKEREDYWCYQQYCPVGMECCIRRGDPEAAGAETLNAYIESIAKWCAEQKTTKEKLTYQEMEQILWQAEDKCASGEIHDAYIGVAGTIPGLIVVPLEASVYHCGQEVKKRCSAVLGFDLEVTQLDCDNTCDNPKGCMCPSECPIYDERGNQIGTARWEPTLPWHVTQGWNCRNEHPGGGCSGNLRDGICPRYCFFFNDEDCKSEKTIGYFLGDMATKFIEKQKWFIDFMEWVESWSKWIDPKQWARSWCNPVNREQDILLGAGIYSDDSEPLGWYGGEIQVYNYTSKSIVSHYLYTITWGIGNLDESFEYRISLMKEMGGPSVRAFPGSREWFKLKEGESHQGKDTAKAFFLKKVYKYVCMEFNETFQGSARHCREISAEGEYRATGDPAVVEGATSTGGATDPGKDNTINCELVGIC